MLVIIQMTPRAERGTGALTIAVDGHWNSRIAGNVGSSGPDRRLTNASVLDEILFIIRPPSFANATMAKQSLDGYREPQDAGSVAPTDGGKSHNARGAHCGGRRR